MAREQYVSQIQLLVRSLPHIGEEKAFALKGGTAINLFYRNLPRLSVDIDLTYLPVMARDESLKEIDETLERIGSNISQQLRGASAGKLHAAVDRQHPRDLFDVKLLYANAGFTDALFRTFLV
jgi:predicted nucleotidyltransferase component of viral defense system